VLQRRPNTFAQTILSLLFFACDKAADHTFRFARDSAGTQTGQTRIVSCDRLVSTTIYAIWGLPINELYTSGPCRPLIRYPSEANLSVIFRSKVE